MNHAAKLHIPKESPIFTPMKCLITIVGPTAVGKTSLSLRLANLYDTHILSGDSRQMYRFMDIGTAKPTQAELALAPHHFIDCLNPDETYSAGQYERDADQLIDKLFQSHDVLIVAGGSTLYMNALWHGFNQMPEVPIDIRQAVTHQWQHQGLDGLLEELEQVDPHSFAVIDQHNPARVIRAVEFHRATGKPISDFRTGPVPKAKPYQVLKIGLQDERIALYERINQRVLEMIEAGLEQECRKLLQMGYSPDMRSLQSIGYTEMYSYLAGEIPYEEAIRLIQRNSRRYAKRQLTYYRKFSDIKWFQAGAWDAVEQWVEAQRS